MNKVDYRRLHDKNYRLNNLYHIINKKQQDQLFVMNAVQEDVQRDTHKRKVVLKARQLGMSTFAVLDLLDDALWTPNATCGIVSYSLDHASHIFKKIIGYALDNLPPWLDVEILSRSAREITFGNNSTIRVDTSLRGGSYQNVLISEFGKTCARNPIKAEEVVTGTLETIPIGGKVTIESTGEGSEGYFYDIVNIASQTDDEYLTDLDYKLFFYTWLDDKDYRLKKVVDYDVSMKDYFNKIETELNTTIDEDQKSWYITKAKTLGEKVQQEYPSTVTEAFMANSDAYFYASEIKNASDENRFLQSNPFDALLPVYVAMDLGVNDLTVMTFFQVCHGETRVIDYYEDHNKGVDFYANFLLKDKPYHYTTIYLPHDAVKRSNIDVQKDFASEFRRLFVGTDTKFIVMKRQDKQASIAFTKIKMRSFVYNINRVKKLLDHCSKYRKKWSEPLGKYLDEPLHDIHSNFADCLQYTAQAVGLIEAGVGLSGAYDRHKEITNNRRYSI